MRLMFILYYFCGRINNKKRCNFQTIKPSGEKAYYIDMCDIDFEIAVITN